MKGLAEGISGLDLGGDSLGEPGRRPQKAVVGGSSCGEIVQWAP
jgi:hypothetical protein